MPRKIGFVLCRKTKRVGNLLGNENLVEAAKFSHMDAPTALEPSANLDTLAGIAANLLISLPESPQGKPFIDRNEASSPAALLRAMRKVRADFVQCPKCTRRLARVSCTHPAHRASSLFFGWLAAPQFDAA